MIIGVPGETYPGENRVAIVPATISLLKKAKLEVLAARGIGAAAGFSDAAYQAAGAVLASSPSEVYEKAHIIVRVRALGAAGPCWKEDLAVLHAGQVVVGVCDALTMPEPCIDAAEKGITAFALDLVPRTTRAQSMDVLSSQANLAGYKAVILAADTLKKIFPMMMTAAGTITPARVFVVGAGVAGLQAIATAKRLGAVVSAYDVRPASKEQVESLGARFVQLEVSTADAQDTGGYAKALGQEFYRKQAELMMGVVAESDVVITTAAVPGQKAPILITREMVEHMAPGSVVVDIAAERGGNCELTTPGVTREHNGVTIIGPLNIPSSLAYHASQLYSKNIASFLINMVKDGELAMDTGDEIVAGTLLTKGSKVVHVKVNELLSARS